MHSAPAVSFPAGRPRIVLRTAFAVWTTGVVCSLVPVGDVETWRSVVSAGTALVVGAVASRHLHRPTAGMLRFDGQHWSISGAGPSGPARLQVCLDLQSTMLLRLATARRGCRWVWVERRDDRRGWVDLRRAVYSRAPTSAAPDEPGSAPASGGSFSAFR